MLECLWMNISHTSKIEKSGMTSPGKKDTASVKVKTNTKCQLIFFITYVGTYLNLYVNKKKVTSCVYSLSFSVAIDRK
jgi:hypothetical protein